MIEGFPMKFCVPISLKMVKSLKNDHKFIKIVRLSRFLNQLNFCFEIYISVGEDGSPIGIRRRFNAILFSVGVLNEMFNLFCEMESNFTEFVDFTKRYRKLKKQDDFKLFSEFIVRNVRDSVTFHFDKELIPAAINSFSQDSENPDEEYNFLASHSHSAGEIYYEFADSIAMAGLSFSKNEKKILHHFESPEYIKILQLYSVYVEELIDFSRDLVAAYLVSLNLEVKEIE